MYHGSGRAIHYSFCCATTKVELNFPDQNKHIWYYRLLLLNVQMLLFIVVNALSYT